MEEVNHLLITDARERMKTYPKNVLPTLRAIEARNGKIYLPFDHAGTWDLEKSVFGLVPAEKMDGRVSMCEAVAMLCVHNEVRSLTQLWGKDDFGVRTLLKLEAEDRVSEVLTGMIYFSESMKYVAKIREMVVENGMPEGVSSGEVDTLKFWWNNFAQVIVDDGFFLGTAVAYRMIEVMRGLEMRDEYTLGVELAAQLYLDVLTDDPADLIG